MSYINKFRQVCRHLFYYILGALLALLTLVLTEFLLVFINKVVPIPNFWVEEVFFVLVFSISLLFLYYFLIPKLLSKGKNSLLKDKEL